MLLSAHDLITVDLLTVSRSICNWK